MRILFVLLLLFTSSMVQARSVAITIDDLPVVPGGQNGCDWNYAQSITRKLTDVIRREKVPVTAFVVAGNCANFSDEQRRTLLRMWRDAGAEFGNHTFSHPDLNTMPVADYESDVLRADEVLRGLLGVDRLRWFRSPMLHTGADAETRAHLAQFLASHQWRQAPVTFDNSDWKL